MKSYFGEDCYGKKYNKTNVSLLYLFSQEEDEIEDFDMRNICPNEEYV